MNPLMTKCACCCVMGLIDHFFSVVNLTEKSLLRGTAKMGRNENTIFPFFLAVPFFVLSHFRFRVVQWPVTWPTSSKFLRPFAFVAQILSFSRSLRGVI